MSNDATAGKSMASIAPERIRAARIAAGWIVLALASMSNALPSTAAAAGASANQFDIAGPGGNVAFGTWVKALPNGNIVIVDPQASVFIGGNNVGAVYLYDHAGTLISTLTGSTNNDEVGGGGIAMVGANTFVVLSPTWSNGAAANAGAVTFIDGAVGLSANVSPANSLVGSQNGDEVGIGGIVVLTNGNYVVRSVAWNGFAGAATWEDAAGGVRGAVSSANSLVGSNANDYIGYAGSHPGIVPLSTGNYAVVSPLWNAVAGAVTWGNGVSGTVGVVGAGNSLVGAVSNSAVGFGGAVEVGIGNYVVASPMWSFNMSLQGAATWCNGAAPTFGDVNAVATTLRGSHVSDQVGTSVTALATGNYLVGSPHYNGNEGAVTLCNGADGVCTGTIGPETQVTATDSFTGLTAGDAVGTTVVALTNGNAAVGSPGWNGARGAVTLINGSAGRAGEGVSGANSLVGATASDGVGNAIVALTNGNFVAPSPSWNNGAGAATWVSGTAGLAASVSAANSLVGSSAGDSVGSAVVPLTNGNYVVGSPSWQGNEGAATWGSGSAGVVGAVSQNNSLTGSTAFDAVGSSITALTNGNYVVASPNWSNNTGAATWGDGTTNTTGAVGANNSLIGANAGDFTATTVFALANGDYVVYSNRANYGASSWRPGTRAMPGVVSSGNSLLGTSAGDTAGAALTAFADGNYLLLDNYYNNSSGAITFGSGAFELRGTVQPWNSVIGQASVAPQPSLINASYDAPNKRLVVGRPADNIVTVFTPDQVFSDGFE